MKIMTLLLLTASLLGITFVACDDLLDEDATTHCQAICDWAVACQTAQQEGLDADQAKADCISALETADSSCTDSLEAKKSAACTSEIEGRTDMCDIFTGDAQTRTTANADLPAACAPKVELFSEAAAVTGESGDALCARVNGSVCGRLVECLGDYGIPQAALDEINATDLCLGSISSIEDRCKSEGLYDASSDVTMPNPTRDYAMQCADAFAVRSCDDFFTSAPDMSCGLAFASADQVTQLLGGLQSFACGQNFSSSVPGCQ
jgi:hypothetical protein